MRFIGIGLAAMMAMLVLAPQGASAAPRKDPRQALAEAKFHERGKTEAPPLVKAGGLHCKVTDARLIGEDVKNNVAVYEVACSDNIGLVLEAKTSKEAPPALQNTYTCLHTAGPGPDGEPNSMACTLSGNTNIAKSLQVFIDKYGRPCEADKARYVGQSQKELYVEIACKSGTGFILVTSWPPNPDAAIQMNTCLIYESDNNLSCRLTDRAAQLAPVDALVAKSGRNCTIKDRRHVLSTKDGDTYYEVSCDNGTGYVVEENSKGGLTRLIDCANADFVAGGCTMTDTRAAKTEQADLYTKLAEKSGFPCTVQKYAPLPTTGAKEVVELKCSNRPDGGIAIFSSQGGTVLNCVLAELEGYRCSFTEKSAVFPKLTDNLKTLGKTSCVVSDARVVGKTGDEGFIEVACADGLPGWVIGYPSGSDKPKEVLGCLQAANIGAGCKLPTNRRG